MHVHQCLNAIALEKGLRPSTVPGYRRLLDRMDSTPASTDAEASQQARKGSEGFIAPEELSQFVKEALHSVGAIPGQGEVVVATSDREPPEPAAPLLGDGELLQVRLEVVVGCEVEHKSVRRAVDRPQTITHERDLLDPDRELIATCGAGDRCGHVDGDADHGTRTLSSSEALRTGAATDVGSAGLTLRARVRRCRTIR